MSTKVSTRTLKTRNDLVSEITPMVFNDTGAPQNPHGPFLPAPWLPVEWQDEVSKDYFVISSGKLVCLTTPLEEGWVVPAGLRDAWEDESDGNTLVTYTATDYAAKVMDITTGEAYATNGTTNYTKTQVRAALRERGLIGNAAAIQTYLSKPVGCILGDVFVWAGGNGWNPAHLNFANYQKQKGVQFISWAQMIVPLVPTVHASVNIPGSLTGATPTFGSGNMYNATNTKLLERYGDVTNSNFITLFLADFPMAKHTTRTPVTGSSTDFLVSEKKVNLAVSPTSKAAIAAAVDRLTTAGDYFIDYDVGAVFMYASGGASIPSNVSGESFTYYSYAAAPSTVERYTCAVGNIKIGDNLMVDDNSNFQVWDGSAEIDIVGKVVAVEKHPKHLNEYVRTGWEGTEFTAKQQMHGSASGGYPSQITYSNASDTLVKIVLNVK